MTLSRWRRIATGIAAGVIVLCAALLGASLRSDTTGVTAAADLRPEVVIPIEEDPVAESPDDADADEVQSVEASAQDEDQPDATDSSASADDSSAAGTPDATDATDATDGDEGAEAVEGDGAGADDGDEALTDPVRVDGADDPATAADDDPAQEPAAADDDPAQEPAAADESAEAAPPQPLTSGDPSLGTGGGVSDAECALDRLVIYAGARRGGVAGSIRAALAQAGFAAGCPAPVTVLASNCPLQFAGVLGSGSGYDPNKSFVASSPNVDRETMTAVMGTVGYAGATIDILDFGFINADEPGEQWMAIFIPPSFAGWENLASRAGLAPTAQSLCGPSGRLVG